MKMAVSEFKAKCTWVLREVAAKGEPCEITSRGKTVAVVYGPPTKRKKKPSDFLGSLAGCAEIRGDIIEPAVPASAWEANR